MSIELAKKIVIGVVAGLASKAIFERWLSTKRRTDVEKLKAEIEALKRPFEPAEPVAIQRAVEKELITEGVPPERATRIAIQIITSIRASIPH